MNGENGEKILDKTGKIKIDEEIERQLRIMDEKIKSEILDVCCPKCGQRIPKCLHYKRE